MANRSRAIGTAWAQAICDYLRPCWPHTERRAQNGSKDRGDIAGIAGVVVEAKAEGVFKPAEWLREAETERVNDHADVAVVWAKRRGKTSPGDGYILMTPPTLVRLLQAAGYGTADRATTSALPADLSLDLGRQAGTPTGARP